jgi:hypothetical protein
MIAAPASFQGERLAVLPIVRELGYILKMGQTIIHSSPGSSSSSSPLCIQLAIVR